MEHNIKKNVRFGAVLYGNSAPYEKIIRDGERSLRGGATLLRLYGGDMERERFLKLTSALKEITLKYSAQLIVGDSVTDAEESGADGVHLIFDESEVKKARSVMGKGKIVGVAAETAEEAVRAEELGADYIEAPNVFFTNGKPASITKRYLKKICDSVSIPVVAAGGINYENIESLGGCGICGIAVSHSLFSHRDVENTASMLRYGADKAVLPNSRLQGAIIDMDGTLLDSMKIWNEVGERYLLSVGITPRDDLKEKINTLSLHQVSSFLKHEYNVTADANQIYAELSAIINDFYENEVTLKPGAREFLEELHTRRVPMILLTATEREQVELSLKRFDILKYFDCVLTCDEFGSSKSHRAIFKEARHRIGTPRRTTWVFDDSPYAIAAAKRAELRTAAVYDEYSRRKWSKISDIADIAFKNLSDFPFNKF